MGAGRAGLARYYRWAQFGHAGAPDSERFSSCAPRLRGRGQCLHRDRGHGGAADAGRGQGRHRQEIAVPDAGARGVDSRCRRPGGQGRRNARRRGGNEDAERAARRARRHGEENPRRRRRDAGGRCADSGICVIPSFPGDAKHRTPDLEIPRLLLPQPFGQTGTQLISLEEGVGKMKAALDARDDPTLVIMGRTGAVSITSLDDAIARARAYEAGGVDALFFTGVKTRGELEAISAATKLPIVLGGAPDDMADLDYLAGKRVRIALQGHAPFAAATQAVYETLKALRDGQPPKNLKGLASLELTNRVTRDADVKARSAEVLVLKK